MNSTKRCIRNLEYPLTVVRCAVFVLLNYKNVFYSKKKNLFYSRNIQECSNINHTVFKDYIYDCDDIMIM